MRFPSTFILAFTALTCLVSSQATSVASSQPTLTSANGSQNPISNPLGGTLEAGSPITITWNPTYGNSVDLVLRQGKETDLDKVETIASGIPNSGAFVWEIPQDLVAGSDYSIQIISGAESNYSPQFGIDSLVTSSSTSSTSSSFSLSPSSSSSSSSLSTSGTKISTSAAVTATASTSSLTLPSTITVGSGTSNSSSATMRTSTSSPTITATTAPNSDQATSINAGVHLASPLVLMWCLFSCLIYLG